ncbi:MAG: sigma-70 family RNA polymerase sigma factor [Clostridia bacterium]
MINIDKEDKLYKYLLALGANNIDELYIELATNGRYNLDDVRQYFRSIFEPSKTEDIEEKELEKILDYYVDLKHIKSLNKKELTDMLTAYKLDKNDITREKIINSQLKDILYLCLNYKTMHKDVDIQDLVQMANIGLFDAIENYDPKAKVDFKDYLVYWIRERITKEFEEDKND